LVFLQHLQCNSVDNITTWIGAKVWTILLCIQIWDALERYKYMQGQMFFIFILYFSRCLVVVSAVASLRHITTRRSWTMIIKITKCCQGHTFSLHRFKNVFFASFLLFWLVFNLYANNRWPTVTSENVLFNWPIVYRNFNILKIDMFKMICSILPIYKHFFIEKSHPERNYHSLEIFSF